VRPISEDEMLAVFVAGEVDSPRWGEELRALGDLGPRQLLEETRAYERREGLFFGFPHDIEWFRTLSPLNEVLDILYIDWDWWLRISGGTRSARDAARRVRAREFDAVTVEEHEPIARSRAPLIAVTDPARTRVVLVEGHARLTAYALFPELAPAEVELILGVSPHIAAWCQF
jgi:hypothetical protein